MEQRYKPLCWPLSHSTFIYYISHCGAEFVFVSLMMITIQQCSIDALLERTIKHMLFLQSVTKHADKLKQTGESKVKTLSVAFPLFVRNLIPF